VDLKIFFLRGKTSKRSISYENPGKPLKNQKFYALDWKRGIPREVIFESFETENLHKRNLHENIE
jgi:hypothetical protein